MRILVMNGSAGNGVIALVEHTYEGMRLVRQAEQPGRGGAEALPGSLRTLLQSAGWEIGSLGLIAAVTGPGSFTGLRATLALAHGLALGAGLPLQGVSAAEALRRTLGHDHAGEGGWADAAPEDGAPAPPSSMPLWCVGLARRDRVFLERCEELGPEAFMLDALPLPSQPVLLAGDASVLVAARIRQAGGVARCSGVERPDADAVALIALDRHQGRLPPRAALPLYVDAPEARRPASGLRPLPS